MAGVQGRAPRANKVYCLKQIVMEAYSDDERALAEQEVEVLRTLDHPGIVRYYEHFVADDSLCVVMAYCEGGDLARVIKQRADRGDFFSEGEILDWFVQIVMALHHIHTKRILHRDLKTQNIFISKNLVKLGDFGIAKVMEGSMTAASTVIGTPYYMSPEVCQSQRYSYKSDVWALGCILYEMCALQQAWSGSNLLGLVYKIVQETYPPVPDRYSAELKRLVGQLLSKEPDGRPELRQILQQSFIRTRMQHFVSNALPHRRHPTVHPPCRRRRRRRPSRPPRPPPAPPSPPPSPPPPGPPRRRRRWGSGGGEFAAAAHAVRRRRRPAAGSSVDDLVLVPLQSDDRPPTTPVTPSRRSVAHPRASSASRPSSGARLQPRSAIPRVPSASRGGARAAAAPRAAAPAARANGGARAPAGASAGGGCPPVVASSAVDGTAAARMAATGGEGSPTAAAAAVPPPPPPRMSEPPQPPPPRMSVSPQRSGGGGIGRGGSGSTPQRRRRRRRPHSSRRARRA